MLWVQFIETEQLKGVPLSTIVRRGAPNSKRMAIRSALSRARSVLDNQLIFQYSNGAHGPGCLHIDQALRA